MASTDSTTGAGEQLTRLAEAYIAAWNDCDVDAMAQLITEDIHWADPAMPEPAEGVPAVQEWMRLSFRAFPDLRFSEPDPQQLMQDGDLVAWGWIMEGTMRGPVDPPGFAATGRRMRVQGVDLWWLRDGRIARYRAFYDMMDLARQLGIMPAPGSRAERASVALQRLQARLQRR